MGIKIKTFHRVGSKSFDSEAEVINHAKQNGYLIESVTRLKGPNTKTLKYNLHKI